MIIKASDIKIGTQLAESDGFLFDVVEIVKETEKTVTVRLCSDFSSFPAHWRTQKDGSRAELLRLLENQLSYTALISRNGGSSTVCRNCTTCTDETGHNMKGWLIL